MNAQDPLLKQLELARRDLLELSTHNRLLDTTRDDDKGCSLEIKDEISAEIFRQLITENSAMRFEQGEEVVLPKATAVATDAAAETDEAKPVKKKRVTKKKAAAIKEEEAAVPEVKSTTAKPAAASEPDPNRHTDAVLNTELDPEELDRRLLALVTDATNSVQEKGVNILYLALGFLRWFEGGNKDTPRFAPLLLIPVRLERENAGTRFRLVYTGDEIETNLTLKILLKSEYGITLPEVPATEDLSPSAYFKEVEAAIKGQSTWQIQPNDIVLWFFSFSKLLLYRDLDPAHWPENCRLADRPLIRALLQDGFPAAAPLCDESQRIDSILDPANTAHVVDCDSSQTLVVEEACRGRSLVIQGPPGTGKSQTITNLIAATVRAGKTILFVAEKMAALQVVKRRLDKVGIGDICLELHSDMASKQAVLAEVDRTLKLGRPKPPPQLTETIQKLKQVRDQLNGLADVLHEPLLPSGQTPYQILGELIELRAAQTPLPDFQLAGSEAWSADDFQQRFQALHDYAQLQAKIGSPQQHPWRGCQLEQMLPLDLERLLAEVPKLATALEELLTVARQLAQKLGDDVPASLANIGRVLRTVAHLAEAPKFDPQPLTGTAWSDHRAAIHELAEGGRSIIAAKEKLTGVVHDAAFDLDVSVDRAAYARYGQSWYRMFCGSYRKARGTLLAALVGPQPDTFEARLAILELFDARRKAQTKVAESDLLGAKAFGRFWLGKQTDWEQIAAWEKWDSDASVLEVSPRFRQMRALIEDVTPLQKQAQDLEQRMSQFLERFEKLCDTLKLNHQEAFGTPPTKTVDPDHPVIRPPAQGVQAQLEKLASAAAVPVEELRQRLAAWQSQPERLQEWQHLCRVQTKLQSGGAQEVLERIAAGKLPATEAAAVFKFAYYESLLRKTLEKHPQLNGTDGGEFAKLVQEFRDLDEARITLARFEVAEAHYRNMGRPRGPQLGEAVNILRHESQKKRRHLPLRQLIQKAGPAIQAVKPVFMMSPLSVSQYLEAGTLEFDMLLIDEASQVRPVEALAAAARCRQMVVVGDDKQMPPTQFFATVLGDAPLDNDEPQVQAGDVESILGLCISRNMPQRMLRWHYRSKHQSLITVSNREFYENQLYIIPSPERTGELGLKYHRVEGGKFSGGKNEVEAKIVANAVLEHAKQHPNWTLGVAAFSVAQRDTILKEVERLRREQPACEKFFDPNAPDPFFVKNLENVQGDERDVMMISIGYGPNEDGKVSLNFGPVSASGGERRLNVLITRAKRRCEVFSSMRAEDIDLTRATGRGPAVLRAFLQFAQTGGETQGTASSKSEDLLVEVLRQQLTARNYEVRANVGVAGVFIDLAVVDPDDKNRYVLGIEVDGPGYRNARTARDRERLRESVLSSQGWQLHRIRATEWFQRPTEQLNRLIEAIEAARRNKGKSAGGPLETVYKVERQEPSGDPLSSLTGEAVSVAEAAAPAPTQQSMFTPELQKAMLETVVKVVEVGLKAAVDSQQAKGDETPKKKGK